MGRRPPPPTRAIADRALSAEINASPGLIYALSSPRLVNLPRLRAIIRFLEAKGNVII